VGFGGREWGMQGGVWEPTPPPTAHEAAGRRQKDMKGVKHETRRKWQYHEVAGRKVVNKHQLEIQFTRVPVCEDRSSPCPLTGRIASIDDNVEENQRRVEWDPSGGMLHDSSASLFTFHTLFSRC
jgi:hypothetical protein